MGTAVDFREPLDELDGQELEDLLGDNYDPSLDGDDSIEYIKAAEGEKGQDRVDDGETYERKIIDNSADDSRFRVHCRSNNWTVRDIAFVGTMPFHTGVADYGGISNRHVLYPGVHDPDATGLIENVYAADGAEDKSVAGWMFVDRYLKGTLIVRRCNAQNWVDNALYGSSHGKEAAGKILVEDCYGRNSTTDNFRLSFNDEIIGSVSISDARGPGKGRRGHTDKGPAYTSLNRGVWVRDGDTGNGTVVVRDSDFNHPWGGSSGALHSSGQRIKAIDSRFAPWGKRAAGDEDLVEFENCDDSPDLTPPAGVPMDVSAAVSSAGGSSASSTGGVPELVIEARGLDGTIRYQFRGNASTVRPLALADTGDNSDRPISPDGKEWRGLVGGGADNFAVVSEYEPHLDWIRVYGTPSDLDKLTVTLDGETVPVQRVPKGIVTLDGSSLDEMGRYCVIVEGCSPAQVEKTTARGASINAHDYVRDMGDSVALIGGVNGGSDTFELAAGEVANVMTSTSDIEVTL